MDRSLLTNVVALTDRLLKFRLRRKTREKSLLLFGTQCLFSRMSGVGPALPGGITEENSTRTSKSDSLLGSLYA
jgi:hypothetical protein